MDYHLFKSGIKPMWEDSANRRGGKWMVRLRKGIASRYWEDLVRTRFVGFIACLVWSSGSVD